MADADIEAICRDLFDNTPLDLAGAASTRHIAAILAVEERLGIRFTSIEMDTAETPEMIADLARRKLGASRHTARPH